MEHSSRRCWSFTYDRDWEVVVRLHRGSTDEEIRREPDHSIGVRNRGDRRPGLTNSQSYDEEISKALKELKELRNKIDSGVLVNFRDLIHHQPDFHLRHPRTGLLDGATSWIRLRIGSRRDRVGQRTRDWGRVRYTPVRPILSPVTDTFNLTIKTYYPSENQPGGTMSNILDCIPLGEEVEMCGLTGDIIYHGNGHSVIKGLRTRQFRFRKVSLVLGGTGLTPGYALMKRVASTPGDQTEVMVVYANRTEGNILLREELDGLERESGGRVGVTRVLGRPGDGWDGERGHVSGDLFRRCLFPPREGSVVFLCGPEGMVQGAAVPALKEWGCVEDENMFGF
ncbi:hypothetical protein OQA88_8733 [Cercophora sp. LCS_1]